MTTREISNSDDIIDSRDVIARIEELEAERESLADALTEAQEALTFPSEPDAREAFEETANMAREALKDWDNDNGAELAALKSLAAEAEGYAPDWTYGETLIRDSYFVDYCEELLKDIGDLPKDIPHYIEIDWEKTARNIQVDYTSVDFDGITYWVR